MKQPIMGKIHGPIFFCHKGAFFIPLPRSWQKAEHVFKPHKWGSLACWIHIVWAEPFRGFECLRMFIISWLQNITLQWEGGGGGGNLNDTQSITEAWDIRQCSKRTLWKSTFKMWICDSINLPASLWPTSAPEPLQSSPYSGIASKRESTFWSH